MSCRVSCPGEWQPLSKDSCSPARTRLPCLHLAGGKGPSIPPDTAGLSLRDSGTTVPGSVLVVRMSKSVPF